MTAPTRPRGRPRKPLEKHILEGTYQRSRHGPKPGEMLGGDFRKPETVKRAKSKWKKWIRSPGDEAAVANGCYFDLGRAEHARDFIEKNLCHSKGQWAGEPFKLLKWQWEDIIAPLFGWMNAKGRRRFRKTYIQIPKKNGKSTLASAIGLYMLVADNEGGAEVYSAATDRDQASIVHAEAINMVEASTKLQPPFVRVNNTTRNIIVDSTKSFYRALSAKPAGKEGLNGNCCIVDELHAWYGDELWNALRYMGRARTEPLIFVITTAGNDLETVCYKQYQYAKDVEAGRVTDERFFTYIRECTEDELAGDGILDPKKWAKANPSLDLTIDRDDFKADIEEALRQPSSMSSMKRYSFNVWATSTNPWLDMGKWNECGEYYTAEDMAGQKCYAALDLSKVSDTTALTLLFPGEDWPKSCRLLTYFWLPEKAAKEKDGLVPWLQWAREGWLEIIPGEVVDYGVIEQRVAELSKQFKFIELTYDKTYAHELTQRLEEKHRIKRFIFPQTIINFAGPTAEFEKRVIAGNITHNNNPLLTWQAGCVHVWEDNNGNKRPVKPKQNDHRKIDGIVTGIMALGRATADEHRPSIYSTRGLRTI